MHVKLKSIYKITQPIIPTLRRRQNALVTHGVERRSAELCPINWPIAGRDESENEN